MQEEKELKALLAKWASQQPTAHFTDGVMRQIVMADLPAPTTPAVFGRRLPYLLTGMFVLACIALFVLSIVGSDVALQITITFPAVVYSQVFAFLAAFWTVLLGNMAAKKYVAKRL